MFSGKCVNVFRKRKKKYTGIPPFQMSEGVFYFSRRFFTSFFRLFIYEVKVLGWNGQKHPLLAAK